jgi:hypothetical protein
MNPTHMLIADGGIPRPRICHAIFHATDESADRLARDVVAALARAGYHQFTLLTVDDVEIACYRADLPPPAVIRL